MDSSYSHRLTHSTVGCIACVAICAALAGCGPAGKRLIPVTGSVTVNGKPAAGASILFHSDDPNAPTATGSVAADGTFSIVSGLDAGIAVGKYKVTVIWPDASKKPTEVQIMMGTAEPGPDLLRGKYAAKDSTTLSVEITSSTTTLPPFEL